MQSNKRVKMKTTEPKKRIVYILTYLFLFWSGIIVYGILFLLDKNRTSIRLRINALQAVFLGLMSWLIVLVFVPISLIFSSVSILFSIFVIAILIWIYGLYIGYQAYNGNDVEVPFVTSFLKAQYSIEKHNQKEPQKQSVTKEQLVPNPKTKNRVMGVEDERVKKYLEKGEKVLCTLHYDGGTEFERGEKTTSFFLRVIFVATDRRVLKIRYGFLVSETVDEISYGDISSVYLDNLYKRSFYQLTKNANKTVIRVDDEGYEYKQTDSFKIKPVAWRILDTTSPEAKTFVGVVKKKMAGADADVVTLNRDADAYPL